MNILLTGSNGFLGKSLHSYFKKTHEVYSLNRSHSDFNFDISTIIPLFDTYKFDLVIHCAGKAHFIPKSNHENNLFNEINVLGTENLLFGLEKIEPPKFFVFISSVSVYGLIEGEFINESFPLIAIDPYGKSKIEAESIVKDWCNKNKVICTILRLPLIVGTNPPGNLGLMINAIKKGFYFNIGGGKAKKSMVLQSDVANYLLKAAEVGGVYNLTDGYHPSFFELSQCIANQVGKKHSFNIPRLIVKLLAIIGDVLGSKFPINTNRLSKINSTLTFDDSYARMKFGWKPNRVLDGFKLL